MGRLFIMVNISFEIFLGSTQFHTLHEIDQEEATNKTRKKMEFEILDSTATACIPTKGTKRAAGYDLCASKAVTVTGGQGSVLVPTGIAVKLPPGTYGRIAVRSSLAVREHLAVSAGVIDADYFPGHVQVVVYCTKIGHSYTIKHGDRFAQIIPERIWQAESEEGAERKGGFGSTD